MSDKGLSFGIGSMFFEIDSTGIREWLPSVKGTLENIPSISSLSIDLPGNMLATRDGKGYPIAGVISFNITIPSRMKEQLLIVRRNRSVGELFNVTIIYELAFPVTFVISEQSHELDDGSSGVILLREFLENELKVRPGTARFRTLGPSPFHIDASLEPAEQLDDFALNRVPRRGYERYAFVYSNTSFSSPHQAAARLFPTLAYELAQFYNLVESRNSRSHMIIEIANETQQLIEKYQKSNALSRLMRFFTSGSIMQQLSLKALKAEYRLQRDSTSARANIDRLYSTCQFPCFKDYLEAEVEGAHSTVISNTKDIVSLLSKDRNRRIQVASLFLSALAGGLAGALISVLVH